MRKSPATHVLGDAAVPPLRCPNSHPARFDRARATRRQRALRWLRGAHRWIGLWGALFGLAFGMTGLLLNHRAVLMLPVQRGERMSLQVELESVPASPAALAATLTSRLGFDATGAGAAPKIRTEPAVDVDWGGRTVRQPERWIVTISQPQRQAQAEYFVGSRVAKVDRYDANVLGFMTRLHQSVGVDAAWVLLMDSIAGSFVFLSISGVLLWSRLSTRRLAGAGVLLAPLLIGGWIVMQFA